MKWLDNAVFMAHVHGGFVWLWIAMVPVAVVTGGIALVAFVSGYGGVAQRDLESRLGKMEQQLVVLRKRSDPS